MKQKFNRIIAWHEKNLTVRKIESRRREKGQADVYVPDYSLAKLNK